jgi:hypothetical protein
LLVARRMYELPRSPLTGNLVNRGIHDRHLGFSLGAISSQA